MAQTKNPSNPSVFNENGLATDETLLRFLQTLQGQLPANGIIPAFSLDSNGNPVGFSTPNSGLMNITIFPSGDATGVKDTATFNNVIGLINTAGFGKISIQAGIFYVKGSLMPAVNVPCIIEGAGAGVWRKGNPTIYKYGSTTINNVETNSATITLTGNAIKLRDFALNYISGSNPTFGSAGILTLASTSIDAAINNEYDNISINGFYTNADLRSGGEWSMHRCHLTNPFWVNLRINNLQNYDMGDWMVDGNFFYQEQGFAGILVESSNGGIISKNKFNGGTGGSPTWQYGIYLTGYRGGAMPVVGAANSVFGGVAPASPSNTIEEIQIIDNSIVAYSTAAICQNAVYGYKGNALKVLGNKVGASSAVTINSLSYVEIYAQGSGYVVGDTLTIVGGTGTAATVTVLSVTAGAITSAALATNGAYTAWPFSLSYGSGTAYTRLVTVTGGSGTGVQFWAYPMADIQVNQLSGLEISNNSQMSINNFIQVGNGVTSATFGINMLYGGYLDSQASVMYTTALELAGYAAVNFINLPTQSNNSYGSNTVMFMNQIDNMQMIGAASTAARSMQLIQSHSPLNAAASSTDFTIGLADDNPCFVDIYVNGNQGGGDPLALKLSLLISTVGNNNVPLNITAIQSAGIQDAYASTVGATGTIAGGNNAWTFTPSGGTHTANVMTINVFNSIGTSPQLTPKIIIGLTAAGTAFVGNIEIDVKGGVNRLAYGTIIN